MGEPDCKLIEPYELKQENGENFLTSWPSFTTQKELMIHSDSILTMVQPDKDQLDKYQTLTAKPSITVNEILHQRSDGRQRLSGSWV